MVALVNRADTGGPDRTCEPNDTDQPEPNSEQTLAIWHQQLGEIDPVTAPEDRRLVDAVIAQLDSGILGDEQECAWRRYAYHAAGCCHDAAREITSVWNLWRRDWTTDTNLGKPLLDAMLIILLGGDRVPARHVLTHAPRAATVNRYRIPSSGTGLINGAAEHAPVCTYTASTARTVVAS